MQDLLDHALTAWMKDPQPGEAAWTAFAEGAHSALTDLPAVLGHGRDAAVFTSAGLFAAVCSALLSPPPEGMAALNRVAVNASVIILAVGGSGTRLLTFNEHAHFAGDRRRMLSCR